MRVPRALAALAACATLAGCLWGGPTFRDAQLAVANCTDHPLLAIVTVEDRHGGGGEQRAFDVAPGAWGSQWVTFRNGDYDVEVRVGDEVRRWSTTFMDDVATWDAAAWVTDTGVVPASYVTDGDRPRFSAPEACAARGLDRLPERA